MNSIDIAYKKADKLQRRSSKLLAMTFLTFIASAMATDSKAQTFSEWFFQNRTQKKYLRDQVIALQAYIGYVKTGYSIAKNGLGGIGNSILGEFRLHELFYNKHRIPPKAVMKNPLISEIDEWNYSIRKVLTETVELENLRSEERAYLEKIAFEVVKDCDSQIDKLEMIITPGKASMSDDERLELLRTIHLEMQQNHVFSVLLYEETRQFASNRKRQYEQVKSEIELQHKQ